MGWGWDSRGGHRSISRSPFRGRGLEDPPHDRWAPHLWSFTCPCACHSILLRDLGSGLYRISKGVGLQATVSEDLWRAPMPRNHSPSVDEILGKADVGWGPCDGNLTL